MAEVIQLKQPPTIQERYAHLRDNADAFVRSMSVMVDAAERDGDNDLAVKLKVWCLMPWEAALQDDDTGDLWFVCEACEQPIKDGSEVSGVDCWLHRKCAGI